MGLLPEIKLLSCSITCSGKLRFPLQIASHQQNVDIRGIIVCTTRGYIRVANLYVAGEPKQKVPNETYKISAFYDGTCSVFQFTCSTDSNIPKMMTFSNSFSNQWVFTVLETKVFKYNFLNLYIAKPVLCILLKSVQLTLNKK